MNSASVILRATSVCNLEVHTKGQPAKVVTKQVLDLALDESMCSVSGDELPLKSVSHHKLNDCDLGM